MVVWDVVGRVTHDVGVSGVSMGSSRSRGTATEPAGPGCPGTQHGLGNCYVTDHTGWLLFIAFAMYQALTKELGAAMWAIIKSYVDVAVTSFCSDLAFFIAPPLCNLCHSRCHRCGTWNRGGSRLHQLSRTLLGHGAAQAFTAIDLRLDSATCNLV